MIKLGLLQGYKNNLIQGKKEDKSTDHDVSG
jgi:hypothetical protein